MKLGCSPVIARSPCDEAIHLPPSADMDCFAALAMTHSNTSFHVLLHRSVSEETHRLRDAPRRRGYQCDSNYSVALGAGHAALDPVEGFDTRRRIDTLCREILDIDQLDPLGIGIVFGAGEGDRLIGLVDVR